MQRIINYTIDYQYEGMTILDFLKHQGYSHHVLTLMKTEPTAILLNKERGFGKTLLKQGDILRILIPEQPVCDNIVPTKMNLSILYEDEDILVLNKPADTPIHPSQGNYENTLANGVAYYFAQKGQPFIYRCINRLDRDTTGALILAKNPLSAAILSQQMVQRRIRRTYLALVEGVPPKSGTISAPIARAEGSTIERMVDFANGEYAVTHFELLEAGSRCSLVELHLETGRTHQIRIHMKHIGHPLPGDYLYNPTYDLISRQPLHSYQLEFSHPITKKALVFTAPLPEDFLNAFQKS